MSLIDDLTRQIWGPEEWAAYDATSSHLETQNKLLDAIAKSAFTNLRSYSNCCRSTVWAVQTHLRLPGDELLRASSTLAGGIAGTGETCGSVLGGLLAIGLALGSDGYHDRSQDADAQAAARAFIEAFLATMGSTRCYGVQEALVGWVCDDASKVEAWRDANGPIGCAAVCGFAARLAAKQILKHQAIQN